MASTVFNANDPYEQLIAQMIRLESQPQATLKTRKNEQEVQRAVLNDFDSALSALHTVLDGFLDPIANPFSARSATVDAGAPYGVTATDAASPGSHSLTVERLAAADTRVSQRLDAGGASLRSFFDTNGVQTFSIEVAAPTEDAPDRRVPVAVTVLPVGSTDGAILAEIRQAITDAMSDAIASGDLTRSQAAVASVINETSDAARLSLRSGTTGFDHRLQFSDSDNGLLSLLQLDRAASAQNGDGGWMHEVGTSETDSALNARFVLDGLTLYRGTNSVDDALSGVTLALRATGDAASFSVGTNGTAVTQKTEDFIKKYNAALEFIVRKSKVDAETGKREALAGDSTVRGLRFGMRTDLIGTVAGQPAGLAGLADLGIEINDDGTLKLADGAKLTAAVERDPDAVQRLFNANGDGLATKLQARLERFVGTNGTLDSRKDVLDERIKRLDRQITEWDTRLDRREEMLRQQFAQLQETIALLQGQQTSISSFFYGSY